MYDVYGARPNNMGFSETTDFATYKNIGHFNEGVMKTTTSPAQARRRDVHDDGRAKVGCGSLERGHQAGLKLKAVTERLILNVPESQAIRYGSNLTMRQRFSAY